MDYKKSLEEIEKALDSLIEENILIPIIVEGEKDIEALKKIGVSGTIISVNAGISIIDFCDRIARQYKEIIILTDWDRKGGFLCHTIMKNLQGRVSCNTTYREILSKNSVTKTLEGLPSWINTLKERINKNYE
jgi:5S rRNA maturation endonuclease (ribonuclease M5)